MNAYLIPPRYEKHALWPAFMAHDAARAVALQATLVPAPHKLPAEAMSCSLSLQNLQLDELGLPDSCLPPGLAMAAPRRVASYLGGRLCAERALAGFGTTTGVGRDDHGAPVWPMGFIGSITHNAQMACAAILPADAALALGIDSEAWLDTSGLEAVIQLCMSAAERRLWLREPIAQRTCTAIFSAKEAFFKAAFPQRRRWIDFTEIQVVALDLDAGTLLFRASRDGDLTALLDGAETRLVVADQAVHTSVVICDI